MKKNSKKVDTFEPEESGFSVDQEIWEFIEESNHIENVYDFSADMDAKEAWDFLMEQDKLTPEVILETHWILMKNLDPDIAGAFRHCAVSIGGQTKPFISEALLKDELNNLCQEINDSLSRGEDANTVKNTITKKAHIRFEQWHGFEDGNGRVGRLIYNWHRTKLGLPIHVIHADWPKENGEQKKYYEWFRKNLST